MGTKINEMWEYSAAHPLGIKVGEVVVETFPLVLSKTAFMDLCWGKLGLARFDEIIDKCQTTPGNMRSVARRYDAALTFNKTTTKTLLAMLVTAGMLQQAEADAVLNAWPEE